MVSLFSFLTLGDLKGNEIGRSEGGLEGLPTYIDLRSTCPSPGTDSRSRVLLIPYPSLVGLLLMVSLGTTWSQRMFYSFDLNSEGFSLNLEIKMLLCLLVILNWNRSLDHHGVGDDEVPLVSLYISEFRN